MKSKFKFIRFGSMHWLHWLIVGLSLALTFGAWHITQKQVEAKRISLFEREANYSVDLVQERMEKYVDALLAAVSFVKSNKDEVSLYQWRVYVNHLDIIKKYPGINGVGIIYRVSPDNREKFIEEQRVQQPAYSIHPKHDRGVLFPITYIVPSFGNEKAIGLDVAHEKNRYAAAIKSVLSGDIQVTGPIELVQDSEKTPGFLLYAPFYKDGPYFTEQERDENFLGLVYSPFIMNKLMVGVLAKESRLVAMQLSDDHQVLYSELSGRNKKFDADAGYHFQKRVSFYGRIWEFTFAGSKALDEIVSSKQPLTILIFGLTVDVLLLFLFSVISANNKRAVGYAQSLTKGLAEKTKRLENANSQLEAAKKSLEKMALFDPLTGLPNRYGFMNALTQAVSRAKKNGSVVCVLFLDIDNFKVINDNMGHEKGDAILKVITSRLKSAVEDVDFLGRLSADDFCVIIEGDPHSVSTLSFTIKKYMQVVHQPIENEHGLSLDVSVGVALYPKGGETAKELLVNAEIAMYKAKEDGGGSFRFFDEETNKRVKRHQEVSFALESAVLNDEFTLVYQPQVRASDSGMFGVEALLRWHSAALGVVGPDEFIPIAEESRIINTIGLWVFNQVGIDYKKLMSISPDMEISINISIRQLENTGFRGLVGEVIAQHEIDPRSLTFEVTETAAMKSPESIIEVMHYFNKSNICFSLDDFGTGYSSMSYLKLMPISHMKIDKSFISDIESDHSDAEIVKAIISLAKAINVKTIAEGVETESEREFLLREGCDFFQGYYFDKPLELAVLLEKYISKS